MKYLTKLKQDDVSCERLIPQSCWKEKPSEKKKPNQPPNPRVTTENISLRMEAAEHKTLCTKLNVFQLMVDTDIYFQLGHRSLKYYSSK